MTFLSIVDLIALGVILLCAGDALRVLHLFEQPVRSIAFLLVAIGAFGQALDVLHGYPVKGWAFALHSGFAIYAVLLFVLRNPGLNRYVRSHPSLSQK